MTYFINGNKDNWITYFLHYIIIFNYWSWDCTVSAVYTVYSVLYITLNCTALLY